MLMLMALVSDAEKTKTFHLSTEAPYRLLVHNDGLRRPLLTVTKSRFCFLRGSIIDLLHPTTRTKSTENELSSNVGDLEYCVIIVLSISQ
jgi:hypothetical protein